MCSTCFWFSVLCPKLIGLGHKYGTKVSIFSCFIFWKLHSTVSIKTSVSPKSRALSCQNKGTVTSYCEAVNLFAYKYATVKVISETDADMIESAQLSNMWPLKTEKHCGRSPFEATEYTKNMCSRALFLKRSRIQSAVVCVHIGAWWKMLEYIVRRTIWLRWQDGKILIATLMQRVTIKRGIPNAELPDAKVVTFILSIQICLGQLKVSGN